MRQDQTSPTTAHARRKFVWGYRRVYGLLIAGLLLTTAPAWAQVTVTATWDANTDPYTAGYRVYIGTRPGEYPWSQDVGTATSVPLTLDSGSYYFVVRAYNAAGELGPESNQATIDLSAPSAPPGLSASVYGSRLTLTWGAPIGGAAASQYFLYVGTAPGAANIVNAYAVGNTLTASGDLGPGRYYARVQASNRFGVGPLSSEISFVVGGAEGPRTPAGLSVSWQGTVATLTWGASEGATAYIVEAGTAAGISNIASFSVGAVTSYAVDVPPGTYYVRVRAANAVGTSAPSNEVVLQGRGAPNGPTSLRQSGSGSTVNLRWTAPSGGAAPTGYVLEAGSAPGLADLAVVNLGAVTTFSTTAPPGTYYVRVRAVNARGSSPASNEIVVRR
jgi:predicted phage tail protein